MKYPPTLGRYKPRLAALRYESSDLGGRPGRAGEIGEYVGVTMDITERKQAEQEREKLRQLEADLAHIDRVSTLGEMAASLAHEIKQPIAAAITSANSCI